MKLLKIVALVSLIVLTCGGCGAIGTQPKVGNTAEAKTQNPKDSTEQKSDSDFEAPSEPPENALAKPEKKLSQYQWIKMGMSRQQVEKHVGVPQSCTTTNDAGKKETSCTWGDTLDSKSGNLDVWYVGGKVIYKSFSISKHAD
jgi:hypothetical protein